ncbi:MAG: putative permease family protein [Streblomastix strix]|uniref:Putative permease family protein n=1 Tax=Streblomastix strix TaxID=222440 RepID=A0A5J4VIQ4_9EUKA|nr:MAG: putative permease family protein [Streblomastix strix]
MGINQSSLSYVALDDIQEHPTRKLENNSVQDDSKEGYKWNEQFYEIITRVRGALELAFNYVTSGFRRQIRVPLIGAVTVLIVVFFIGFIFHHFLIFWNISENEVTQNDFTIFPGSLDDIQEFPTRKLEKIIGQDEQVLGISTRIALSGNCRNKQDGNLNDQCVLLGIESQAEYNLGIGRNWTFGEPDINECHASRSLTRKLRLAPNEDFLSFSLSETQSVLVTHAILPIVKNFLSSRIPGMSSGLYDMINSVRKPMGKYQALGNILVVEKKYLGYEIGDAIQESIDSSPISSLGVGVIVSQSIKAQKSSDIWMQGLGSFKNRLDIYAKDQYETSIDIRKRSDKLMNKLGVTTSLHVLMTSFSAQQSLLMIRTFLDQLFISTLLVLIGLGALLIYTLLLSDVEEKTYEYGMLSALGVPNKTISLILVITSEFFAIPGTIVGIGLSALFLYIAISIISSILVYNVPMFYQSAAIALTILLGLLIPIISNFYPIYHAYTSTLRDSLDLYHQLNMETKVSFVSFERMGVQPIVIIISLTVLILGFSLFYFAPTAFFQGNIS